MPLNVANRDNSATPVTSNNVGAVASAISAFCVANEYGDGIHHRTQLQCTNLPVNVSNVTAISFGNARLYNFPEGRIYMKGCMAFFSQIAFNNPTGGGSVIAQTGSGDYSIGTAATADSTLNGNEVNILPSTAMLDPFVGGIGRSNAGSALASAASFDGTGTPVAAFLNVIIDDAAVADGTSSTVFFTGSIQITWEWHGDY